MWAEVHQLSRVLLIGISAILGCGATNPTHRKALIRYVQGYETASKRAFVISIAFGLMSQPIKFRFSSLQTTAVVPLPK